MSIEQVVNAFANKTGAIDLPCSTTIQNGREVQSVKLKWLGGFRRKGPLDPIASSEDRAHVLSKATLAIYLPKFDEQYPKSHRQILSNQNWLTLYHASAHPVAWASVDPSGNAAPHIYMRSIPCSGCGLVLPLGAIQIDHSRPQAGEKMEAVVKFFRHLNLTVGGPKGAKGQATVTGLVGLAQMNAPATLQDRYTLNPLGRMLFQLIVSAGQRQELIHACMDSYANLRPMCAQCNIGRNAGQQNKF